LPLTIPFAASRVESASRDKGRRQPFASRPAGKAPSSPPPPENLVLGQAAPWLWHLAALASFWLLQFKVHLNSDLWFHLAAGRLIWQQKALPATDSWSFTAAGRPWQNHEWLADVFFYLWARAFEVESLIYWQWLVVGITYLLLFRLIHRTTGSYLVAYLLSLLALDLGAPFYEIRPHLWSMLGFMLLILLTAWRDRPPLALPVLFVVWINLHGGAVFGLMALSVTLGCWVLFPGEDQAVEETAEEGSWRRRVPLAAGLWLASCLAILVNPYGWRAITYPFRLAAASRSATRTLLLEWLPPFEPGGLRAPLYPYAIGLFVAAAAILLIRRPPGQWRRNLSALGLGLLTLAMSLQSRRFIPFFGIALALVAAQAWRAVAPALTSRRSKAARPHLLRRMAIPLVLLALAGWRLAAYPLGPRAFDPLSWASRMPIDSLNFMEANGLRGNVFVYYLWGGYVHWRSGGGLRVHFDPRSETVFSDQTIREHEHVVSLTWSAASIVDRSGAEFVLWPVSSPAFRGLIQQLVGSQRWRPLYRDGVSVLLVRSDVAVPAQLQPTPDSGYHRWALARKALDEQRLDEATAALEHALAKDPWLWPACQDLAIARAVQGDRAATLQTVDRCRAIFPDLLLDADELLKQGRPGAG
jgi:hypothetical protein